MNIKKRMSKGVIIGWIIFSALLLAACREKTENLAVPTNIQINNEILSWDKVDNADTYIVDINGVEYETSTTSFDIFETILVPNTYDIKVYACDQEKKYGNSKYSQSIEYELSTPQGLSFMYINDDKTEYMVYVSQKEIAEGKIVIPSEYKGFPVTQIMEEAFSGCNKITGIFLPDTIKDVEKSAFLDCTGLKRIHLPSHLETIEDNVFNGCTAMPTLQIPQQVKTIGVNSFKDCTSLTELTLPEGLKEIDGSFVGCFNLQKLEIPQWVENISYNSFLDCDNLALTIDENNSTYKIDGNCLMRIRDNALILGLKNAIIPNYTVKIEECAMIEYEGTSITIPAAVQSISGNAFNGCPNIEFLNVESDNTVYKSEGNCIIRKTDDALIMGCKTSVIPEYVTCIGKGAFQSCKGLISITIPASVATIEDSAFYNCSDLEKVNFSLGLSSIGNNAFGYCRLKQISLPPSVTTIGDFAFAWAGNKNFTSVVVIPESVKRIGRCAFENSMIYMKATDIPEGWYQAPIVMDTEWWDSSTCAVFKGCTLGYDEDIPYVASFTYYFSAEEEGYCSIAGATELIRYPRIPYREGYIFGGWTTEKDGTVAMYKLSERNKDKVAFLSQEQAKVESGTILYPIWILE